VARNLGDILRRFRPAVAPGPAAPSGVPVDRVAEAEAELAPVFAALRPAIAESQRIVDDGRADADGRLRTAAERAQATLDDARAHIEAARAEAATHRLGQEASARASLKAASSTEVARVVALAEERLPGLVAKVVDAVWATAGLEEEEEEA